MPADCETAPHEPWAMEATAFGPNDPKGWWISEKLDGVRALWDGILGLFWTKNGNPIDVPKWFKAGMPKGICLDGEIWAGRGNFQLAAHAVRGIGLWYGLTFRPFDICSNDLFEDRQAILNALALPGHCIPVEQIECRSCRHYIKFFNEITARGAEGCVLREPESLYEQGRSLSMQKEKAYADEEAEVIGLIFSECGSLRSLLCQFQSGAEFKVSAGIDQQIRDLADTGEISSPVTVRYLEKTKRGAPREPVLVGVRDYE